MTEPEVLPDARQAMRYAVGLAGDVNADALQLDRARTWVAIAAELRAGTVWTLPDGAPGPCQPIGCDNGFHLQGCAYAEVDDVPVEAGETQVIRSPVTADQTMVIEPPLCGHEHCRHSLVWFAPGPEDGSGRMPAWRHTMTNQEVCPVSVPGQPHTYATPRVDSRG